MFGNWTGESAIQYASVAGHKINKIANTLGIVMDIINVKEYIEIIGKYNLLAKFICWCLLGYCSDMSILALKVN